MTRKDVLFVWSNKCEKAFQKIKIPLTTSPILSFPIEGKDFIMFCEAFCSGPSVVLMHNKNVIAYVSRQLNLYEKNYQIHDLELATIHYSLNIWWHYRYGIKWNVQWSS